MQPESTSSEPRGKPLKRSLRIRVNHLQGWVYDRSGGRIGGRIGGQRVLLLTTTGRRSGRSRRTPVQYVTLEGEIHLVAAGGGSPRAPGWWHNLSANPRVRVQIGAVEHRATATILPADKRACAWPLLCAQNRVLTRVQERAGPELPVVHVRLERPGEAAEDS